jgi:hypothetical protein
MRQLLLDKGVNMPFRSKKQRELLKWKKPKVYKKFKKEYGTKIVPSKSKKGK